MARTQTNLTQGAVTRYEDAFAQFEREHPAPAWLQTKRREAIQTFARLGFPTVRDEEWKYTDITPAANLVATPIFHFELNGAAAQVRTQLPFQTLEGHRLAFVNGHYAPDLSHIGELPTGVEISPLSEAIAADSERVQQAFGRSVNGEETFVALNTAFAQDGAFVFVPADVELVEPVHLLFLTTGDAATVSHPRNLILLGHNASLKLVETYCSSTEGVYLTNAVTEIESGAGARIEHTKAQLESPKAFHVSTIQVGAARDSQLRSSVLNIGGRLVRNNSIAVMQGEGAEVTLNGLVLTDHEQHIDNHTTMDHAQPHCASHEMYAHVLNDKSVGVFNGKIFVRLDAQKTDAKQSNRTILLSGDATINAKPQLEILADDVRCTHGATIGQLDETAQFYLQTRGVPAREARSILIRAFAGEVLEPISLEVVRDEMEARITAKLK
ncbi:FeS cluster assembly protein SufD [Abditibacteriota bacterium]|nr:FeS cluster assembly protein SufD [Abditibacteriota bacterium]